MVFGWGKKKFEKQKIETTPLKKGISLTDVTKITEEIRTIREKTLIAETKSLENKIKENLDALLKISKTLEIDNLKTDDIDIHLKILVERGKNQVISTINKEAEWKLIDINSSDDVTQFDNEISHIIKKIGDVLGRQSKVIHIFAKKYASKLKNILSVLDFDTKEIHTIIENHRKLKEDITSISNNILNVNQINEQRENDKKRLLKLQESIESQNNKIESCKNDIEKLKATYEYSEFQSIKIDIQNLDSEKKRIKNDIDLQFTKISRPLVKYSYISSLDKPQKILMEKLIKNPLDVLNQENKVNIITILELTRKSVNAGSISVKDTNKSITQIDETIQVLDNFINKISIFNVKQTKLKDSLKIFNSNELSIKESELIKATKDKNDLEMRIGNIENEISQFEKEIPLLTTEIEAKLRQVSSIHYIIV